MARVVKKLKRDHQRIRLACRCLIMTVPNSSIPVELNGGVIGSNLAKCRSLIFGLIFLALFLWQRMHFLPTCFIIDLPFKIQYILLMFDRIYSGPWSPWLSYFLAIGVVVWCSVGKIIWYFHSYGIFCPFQPTIYSHYAVFLKEWTQFL